MAISFFEKGVRIVIGNFTYERELLITELCTFLNKENTPTLLEEYKKKRIRVYYGYGNVLSVITHKNKYTIGITKEKKRFYWILRPYNGSYFKTEAELGKGNLEIVLFAIKENEELYSKKKK